jgi:hypothetical protein
VPQLSHETGSVVLFLKLMRREVVADMHLRESGFALNAETGLQPLILGYRVKEVPISWINRFPGMGASSFRLVRRAGGGCWRVLLGVWLKQTCDAGPYGDLRRGTYAGKTASKSRR